MPKRFNAKGRHREPTTHSHLSVTRLRFIGLALLNVAPNQSFM